MSSETGPRVTVRAGDQQPVVVDVLTEQPVTATSTATLGDISPRAFRYGLALAFILGYVVRARALASDFPLNDGGLFYAMTRDLQRNQYRLPSFTSYNNAHIPFAYPPVGFYVSGLLDSLTPMNLIDVFRLLPFAASLACIPAFVALARLLLPSRRGVLVAAFAFALIPRSFIWLIMGGGVTRALGTCFAILALHQATVMYRSTRPTLLAVIGAAVFCTLTVLTHIETAWFLAFSVGVLFVHFGPASTSVRKSIAVACLTLLLSAPWFGLVLSQHGTAPFLSAARSESLSSFAPLIALQEIPASEPIYAVLTSLGLLGAFICLAQRKWFFPAWLLLAAVLEPRAFPSLGCIPLALLASIGVTEGLIPFVSRAVLGERVIGRRRPAPAWLVPASCAIFLTMAVLSALVAQSRIVEGLSATDRAGMAWVQANTPSSATVLVISGDRWGVDRTSEWFPVLADRQSVATVQGSEWLRGGRFSQAVDRYESVQKCSDRSSECLAEWSAETGISFDYVYIPKLLPSAYRLPDRIDCCALLRARLASDRSYSLVYDDAGATIFKHQS